METTSSPLQGDIAQRAISEGGDGFRPYKKRPYAGQRGKQMKKGCKYLTLTQRRMIEDGLKSGASKKTIATEIGMSLRTVYREIKRGECVQTKRTYDKYGDFKGYKYYTAYSADIAEEQFRLNMTAKGRPLKLGNDYAFVKYMEKRVIEDKISPRAVLGEIERDGLPYTRISRTTLYRYIRMDIFPHIAMTSERAQKKREHATIKRAPRGTSIEQRPQCIAERSEFGHWEMDCICCDNTHVFLSIAERLTRFVIMFKMSNQSSNNVVGCLDKLEYKLGKKFSSVFKTITVDNGSEFSNCKGMERSIFNKNSRRVKMYYCHPYSAYERGTNERLNREVRRLVPKGADLSKYTQSEVEAVAEWVNKYPREIFGFETSEMRFKRELAALGLSV